MSEIMIEYSTDDGMLYLWCPVCKVTIDLGFTVTPEAALAMKNNHIEEKHAQDA